MTLLPSQRARRSASICWSGVSRSLTGRRPGREKGPAAALPAGPHQARTHPPRGKPGAGPPRPRRGVTALTRHSHTAQPRHCLTL